MDLFIVVALWTLSNLSLGFGGVALPCPRIQYTRDFLLQWTTWIRIAESTSDFHLTELPDEIRRDVNVNLGSNYKRGTKVRKRGKRRGVRLRLKEAEAYSSSPALPDPGEHTGFAE
ncbi:hypothetical protein N1851_013151 [Merluccius polli]|uniref:Uncharacterized protein n=1 Tax=Merluccius polli TaxID=89951 RepID=A0AA47MVE4_MERPO|nr:hypothetical protein N1851_013151 [Merluccius polli]